MYLAIDIGGTKTLLAVFSSDGVVLEQIKFATPKDYSEFLELLQTKSLELEQRSYKAGAVGVRGMVDRSQGRMLKDSILSWKDVPLAEDCKKIFNCSFQVENDSKLAGLAEVRALNKIPKTALYITISTGIGSAYLVGGDLDSAVINSELGKTLYEHDGKIQPWEDFASGRAIVEKFGKRASEINDTKTWNMITDMWAPGFINALAAYTPEIVILGGGVGAHFQKFAGSLQNSLQKLDHEGIVIPPIVQAKRPEEAVIYGCYELAKQGI